MTELETKVWKKQYWTLFDTWLLARDAEMRNHRSDDREYAVRCYHRLKEHIEEL